MSSTDRQNRLLLNEDWKRVYQSFRNADFQSYDFDNLRRTMINYLRQNYPEDFNDYIESSEYLALIDLIAFLGQNLSFRIDLNARENFLELAERRESVLRLARLLSYNPKRNQAANGLLKFDSISTTEDIIDSNNTNLSRQTIVWNDFSNPDWYEQFVKVLNAALPANGVFGRPVKTGSVEGVSVEQYRFNALNTDIPAYAFTKAVDGRSTQFEVVSTDIDNGSLIEEPPLPGNNFAFLYRDDGQGAGSNNTGFFAHFRQGRLDQGTFNITNPSTNQVVAIDSTNINNSDVWLYKLDSNGLENEIWTKVDAVEGNNVVYNSLSKNIRNIYSVLTRVEDRISLIFSDGVFGTLPKGSFKVYYRVSDNRSYLITPDEMVGITISLPYQSKRGTSETLTIGLELRYTVDNASTAETNASIKANAPSTYYTQNRMITGEDYNVAPLAVNQEIVKVKSVNRTSSGISRYFDILDATGKYSKTNLYGSDGVIYTQYLNTKSTFTFNTRTDIEGVIRNQIENILSDYKIRNFYYSRFPKFIVSDLGARWNQVTRDQNRSTGYLTDATGAKLRVGTFTGSTLQYLAPNSMLKFVAPTGYHFMPDGSLMLGEADHPGATTYKWVKVISVSGPGTDNTLEGLGPIVFNDIIPGAPAGMPSAAPILTEIKPIFTTTLEPAIRTQVIDQIFTYKTFGLRYDFNNSLWRVIVENNLNINAPFSTGKTGDLTNQQQDASWLLLFQTDGETYTITYRGQRYVFESDKEIRFYFDSSDKVYDPLTNEVVKDRISLLSINNKFDNQGNYSLLPYSVPFDWEIVKEYRDRAGYVDSKKIEIGFFDSDDDGVVDNPELFEEFVTDNTLAQWIFLEKYTTTDNVDDFRYVSEDAANIIIEGTEQTILDNGVLSYPSGTLFYIVDKNVFKRYNTTTESLEIDVNYRAYRGRDQISFQYVHSADESNRIDPSSTNIIDVYMLTRRYDIEFRQYINGTLTQRPMPPSSDALFTSFGQEINKIKSISDEVIYHPVKYKVLFGNEATDDLKATFKIVKNPDRVVNDNDVKARVIAAIDEFFAIENWEFGDTFYFTELSTYIMNQVSLDVSAIVIVPIQDTLAFGSMFEIKSEADEIFISSATVENVEVISSLTASRLRSEGAIFIEDTQTQGVTSSTGSTIIQSTSTSSSTSSSTSISTGTSSRLRPPSGGGGSSGSGGGGSSGSGGGGSSGSSGGGLTY
jgi:hypothetical protein